MGARDAEGGVELVDRATYDDARRRFRHARPAEGPSPCVAGLGETTGPGSCPGIIPVRNRGWPAANSLAVVRFFPSNWSSVRPRGRARRHQTRSRDGHHLAGRADPPPRIGSSRRVCDTMRRRAPSGAGAPGPGLAGPARGREPGARSGASRTPSSLKAAGRGVAAAPSARRGARPQCLNSSSRTGSAPSAKAAERARRRSHRGRWACGGSANIGPVSNPHLHGSVTPVSSSPARIDHWIGAAPQCTAGEGSRAR